MLNNSLYKTIMRDYDRRQAEEKHLQDLRIQEVYDKLPEYEMLEQQIVSLCAEEARKRIMNSAPNPSETGRQLHAQIEALQNRQKALLLSGGFS